MAEQVQDPTRDTRQLFPPPQTHNANFTSDEDFRLLVELHGSAVVNFIRELRRRKIFVGDAAHRVLYLMLENSDLTEFKLGRWTCRISHGWFCQEMGRGVTEGTIGNMCRPIAELQKARIIKRTSKGNGASPSVYELRLPSEEYHRARRAKTGSGKEHTCAGAGVDSAPVRGCIAHRCAGNGTLPRASAGVDSAPVRGCTPAPAQVGGGDTREFFSSASEEEERGDGGKADAAAALLKFGFSEETVSQILINPVELAVVHAACAEAGRKREDLRRFGLCRSMIREPGRITPKFLDQAWRALQPKPPPGSPAASMAPAMADPEAKPITAEQVAELKRIAIAAKGEANAG